MCKINKALDIEQKTLKSGPQSRLLKCYDITAQNIDNALAFKEDIDLQTLLPRKYWDYKNVFFKKLADMLPLFCSDDYDILLLPGKQSSYSPLRRMSQNELKVLKNYLEENLAKRFICLSNSLAAASILFVKKSSGSLHLCVDYQELNDIMVKNHYSLSLIKETLKHLSQAKYFTKLDVITAFNKFRLKKKEEWKSAFFICYELYEYLVMPFDLHGAPAKFQGYINKTLQNYLDVFVSIYMDDILIYSNTLKEHKQHVHQVLE